MRKLLALAGLAGVTWWLLGRRGHRAAGSHVTVGYADGSAVTLEADAPVLERLQRTAREVVGAPEGAA